MTPVILLKRLKEFIEDQTKDLILSVKVKGGGDGPKERAPQVHVMRLPDKDAETALIPYILLQFIKGTDIQEAGERPESECNVRIVVATYSEDGGEGATDVLNVITRIRTALLKAGVVGEQFLIKKPVEYIVYPDSTAPYYLGEMMTLWEIPAIERETPSDGLGLFGRFPTLKSEVE